MPSPVASMSFERQEVVADPRRRVTVDVGDGWLRSLHWGGECGFQIRLLDPFESSIYPLDPDGWLFEDGGQEFEVLLERRPASNVLRFAVSSWGLNVWPQPDGTNAVYHATRKGNYDHHTTPALGRHYHAGKAFHVARPWAEDAAGRRVWCDLTLPANGVAKLELPRWFWADAVYPVLVDPTFGYTTAGATNFGPFSPQGAVGDFAASFVRTAAAGDTITKLSFYGQGNGQTGQHVDLAAYTVSAGAFGSRLAAGVQTADVATSSPGWADTPAVSQALSAGTVYGVVYGNFTSPGPVPYADLQGSVTSEQDNSGAGVLPATFGFLNQGNYAWSVYATYTISTALIAPPRPTALFFT